MKMKFLGICICLLLLTVALPNAGALVVIGINDLGSSLFFDNNWYPVDHSYGTFVSANDFIVDVIEQMDESMYLGYLENITAFGPRVTGTSACHDAGDYIYDEFHSMGLEVRFHNWSYGGYSDRNVEATLFGTNGSGDAIYIICGHYDTVANCPGADDDASGVATVLSAAYILRQYGFNHTIRFVAFSGEEQWMLGSHEYAREAYESGDNIIAVLNVDMIGFAITSSHGSQIKIYKNVASKWISDFTINVSQDYYDYILIDVVPLGEAPSDQLYFWEYGYDGVFYHEYEFNYYYHTSQDIIDNMNITYATRCSKLIIAALAKLNQLSSNAPDTPTVSGPTDGKIGVEYDFSVVTTDPDDDNVFYYVDWGDGNNDEWIGPYSSGEEVFVSHIWDDPGIYEVKAKAKDLYNIWSDWSEPHIIAIEDGAIIDIGVIKGGLFKVSAEINNIGSDDAIDVQWSIKLDGGAFTGSLSEGTGLNIPIGESKTIKSKLILGFGQIKIIVDAWISDGPSDKREQNGFVFLFFINVNPGG